jgi:hypothetical protein
MAFTVFTAACALGELTLRAMRQLCVQNLGTKQDLEPSFPCFLLSLIDIPKVGVRKVRGEVFAC